MAARAQLQRSAVVNGEPPLLVSSLSFTCVSSSARSEVCMMELLSCDGLLHVQSKSLLTYFQVGTEQRIGAS